MRGHDSECPVEATDDGVSTCTCGYAGWRQRRVFAADKFRSEITRQGNTVTITDVEADYIVKLLLDSEGGNVRCAL